MLTGYTPTAVNAQLKDAIDNFKEKADGVTITQTGEGKQQQETVSFLGTALIIALMLILFILVLQFNSISKPVIILTEIIFSVIGVLLGFAIYRHDDFSGDDRAGYCGARGHCREEWNPGD